MQDTSERTRHLDWLALIMGVSFAFMWSSAFASAKIALADAPPLMMLTVRFLLSGILAVLIAAMMGQRMPKGRQVWLIIFVIGICQNSLYLGLNFLAMTQIPAGLAAIIASSLPLFVALTGSWAWKVKLHKIAVTGLIMGFSGVVIIMAGRIEGGASLLGLGLCVAGVLALTAATLSVRHANFSQDLLMIVGLQMLVGSVTLLPFGCFTESVSDIRLTWSLAAAFTYTTLVPGVIATIIWFRLVGRIGATHAAAYHFLNPALGVLIAYFLLGEELISVDLLGVGLVALSILMVQLAPTRL